MEFLDWCAAVEMASIIDVEALHVAAWIEIQMQKLSAPTVSNNWQRSGIYSIGW